MSSFKDARWRVLPIGGPATLVRSAREVVLWALVGLAGMSLVMFVGGLLVEEQAAESAAGAALDLISRASVASTPVLAAFGLLILGLLGAVEGPVAARALARAVRDGAPATHVPVPDQWDTATASGARRYRIIAVALMGALGLVVLFALMATLMEGPDRDMLAVLGGGTVLILVIWAGIPLTARVLPRWQDGVVEQLERRWDRAHRGVAASQELTEERVSARREAAGVGDRVPGRRTRRCRGLLLVALTASLLALPLLLQVVVAVSHPGSFGRPPGSGLADRAELGPAAERLVDMLTVAFGAAAVLALLAIVATVTCTILLHLIEQRALRRAFADRTGPPPPIVPCTFALA